MFFFIPACTICLFPKYSSVAGGSVKGGQIVGTFPERLSEDSDLWIRGGRMIPTTPWDSIWNSVAMWMGVKGDDELDFVLPNRNNFPPCDMFSDQDLFTNGQISPSRCSTRDSDGDGVPDPQDACPDTPYWADVGVDSNGCLLPTEEPTSMPTAPTSAPTTTPTASPTRNFPKYEAEAVTNNMSDGMKIKSTSPGYTGSGYVDFGGLGTWLEFTSVDGGPGGLCQLDFKYAVGSDIDRECDLTINGQSAATVKFPKTEDWDDWQHDIVQVTCQPGMNVIRLTVKTSRGGPNVDNVAVISACGSSGETCETKDDCCSGLCLQGGTCSSPTAAPTNAPTLAQPTPSPTEEAPEPSKSPTATPTLTNGAYYEVEDATDVMEVTIKTNAAGYFNDNTGWGYGDMGGQGSWFEWNAIRSQGGACSFDFRYTLGGDVEKAPRSCTLSINGVNAGTLNFPWTGGWSNWDREGKFRYR